ncbi:hypothetical protein H5J24_24515 [Chryseobacterium capnotolerans]|uniref:DUF6705 family protein n=1 Tax=Chryseobacterium TaxID=59732 RepID=UPI00083A9C22|nr:MULTISPECIES: DUF6705 family protein [Chryseobacterium]UHO38612.1 hypothetical protein H5J24_24515 [Chryseobacterium capnotolerans]
MKKILTFILIGLFTYCKSQFNFSPGANNPNSNIDKFIGAWVWQDNEKSLELVFRKENILLPIKGNVRADALIGFHKYVSNNLIIESSVQYSDTNYESKKSTILGYTLSNPNKLVGSITHISKNKNIEYEIEYIDSNHIKLLNLKNHNGVKINVPGQPLYDSSITLPANIILTRK